MEGGGARAAPPARAPPHRSLRRRWTTKSLFILISQRKGRWGAARARRSTGARPPTVPCVGQATVGFRLPRARLGSACFPARGRGGPKRSGGAGNTIPHSIPPNCCPPVCLTRDATHAPSEMMMNKGAGHIAWPCSTCVRSPLYCVSLLYYLCAESALLLCGSSLQLCWGCLYFLWGGAGLLRWSVYLGAAPFFLDAHAPRSPDEAWTGAAVQTAIISGWGAPPRRGRGPAALERRGSPPEAGRRSPPEAGRPRSSERGATHRRHRRGLVARPAIGCSGHGWQAGLAIRWGRWGRR